MKHPCRGTSQPLRANDPAAWMLGDDHPTSKPQVHSSSCYICLDPEFARMGLPLCRSCEQCGEGKGHVPADDDTCTVCGHIEMDPEDLFYLDKASEIGIAILPRAGGVICIPSDRGLDVEAKLEAWRSMFTYPSPEDPCSSF